MRSKRHWGNLFDAANVAFMALVLAAFAYPLYYMLIYTVSSPQAAARGLILLPEDMTLNNYALVFRSGDIPWGFLVSASRTVVGSALTVLCSGIFAYLLSKDEVPHRKLIYRFLIVTMYLNAGLIPWYMTMVSYGLKNSFLLYVLPGAINAFSVVLIRTYIQESISPSLEESAMIDGAGLPRIFFMIIMPLSLPILATVTVFSAVGQWNAWTDNLFLVSDNRLKTLQLMLYEYITKAVPMGASIKDMGDTAATYKPTPSAVKMTVTMITVLPILFVYPFLQRYFVKGLMIGAIKG
jgi:ABC-type glycerol-3-phosphate transport system permease component